MAICHLYILLSAIVDHIRAAQEAPWWTHWRALKFQPREEQLIAYVRDSWGCYIRDGDISRSGQQRCLVITLSSGFWFCIPLPCIPLPFTMWCVVHIWLPSKLLIILESSVSASNCMKFSFLKHRDVLLFGLTVMWLSPCPVISLPICYCMDLCNSVHAYFERLLKILKGECFLLTYDLRKACGRGLHSVT